MRITKLLKESQRIILSMHFEHFNIQSETLEPSRKYQLSKAQIA